MKILIVVCNSHRSSFNHAIAEVVRKIYDKTDNIVYFHDLYEEGFKPILPQKEIDSRTLEKLDIYVKRTCKELIESDVLVFIHPNWWGMPPALMKGWIDRIFRQGVAYKFDALGKAIGLLENKKAYVFNTAYTPKEVEEKFYGDPLDNLWKNCILGMCGVTDVERVVFYGVIRSTDEMREKWLLKVQEVLEEEEEI